MKRYEPWVRIARWPTPDWYFANGVYRFIKFVFTRPVRWASRLRVKGLENVPMEGALILAVNHFTWADPVLLGVPLKRPAFYLAKEALFRNRFMRWFLTSAGQIRVDRERGGNDVAFRHALDLLGSGGVLGVFPEGTRSRPGEVKRGKTGVARIALLSGAPVIPVAMTTDDFWPKGKAFPRFGQTVYLNIGKPMHFGKDPDGARDRETARKVTDDIMEEVARLLAEAREAKARGERWS